jgi:hypothetical protein
LVLLCSLQVARPPFEFGQPGDFTIAKASVSGVNVSGEMLHSKSEAESNSGLIGAEYLAWNFADIDVGGMALYLRHPDSR